MRHSTSIAIAFALTVPQLASAAIGDNAVGMNVHNGTQAFIDASADLGVSWVRMDANWFSLEPTADDAYQWGYLDDAVDRANTAGLKVYLTLAYTPAWVPRQTDTDGWAGNDSPVGETEWVDFVTDAVNRYRARGVTHYGIWNESNLSGFFEHSLESYVDIILVPGANAVRAACGDCMVLGPDLAHVQTVDDYLEGVLARAPAGTFDIIAHHNYHGWPEMGVQIWDGDRFLEALESQRFPWSRRDMKQILDAAGWTGEVWITETGYRASPPGDAGEEADQAEYLLLVLDAQLQRAWWTNTFFYEIQDCKPDQPTCDIDGFGLIRATSGTPGTRTFPTDFRLKPAFTALKDYLAAHPELDGTTPAPACGDGVDNDSDGRTDTQDRGCTDALDDDESDDPPRDRLEVWRSPGLVLDGDLSDFGPDGALTLGAGAWNGGEPLGMGDLEVTVRARWRAEGLFLGIEVVDDVHQNEEPADLLWASDSVQLGFDIGQSGGTGYDDVDDHELNFALSGGSTSSYRFQGPAGAADSFLAVVDRSGTTTTYEIQLPADSLPGLSLTAGEVVGFSFLVNEDDGAGRIGWMEWTPGIGSGKVPELFGELALVATESGGIPTTDGGLPTDGGGGTDAGTTTDAGSGTDGGGTTTDGGGTTSDGGTTTGPDGGQEPMDPSCDCSSVGSGTLAVWALLPLFWALRRRR